MNRALFSGLLAGVAVTAACSDTESLIDPAPVVATGPAKSFGLWTPGPNDTCTKEQHDKYSVVGPDGKLWENDVPMRVNTGVASAILEVTCDVMIKLHQGTHSKDAFTNNLHEMVYHIRCNDGSEALTFMAVRQVLSKVNNTGLRISGPGVGFDRYYGGARTHAPN